MAFRFPSPPRQKLISGVRPENWDPEKGNPFLDWETISNDWFIYTVDRLQGGVNESVQLLANRDNSYIIIRSPSYLRETGVFTSQQRRALKEIWSPANFPAYRADALAKHESKLSPERPVLRIGMCILPGHESTNARWGETNLSPTTQHLIATLDQLIHTLSPTNPSFPPRTLFTN